MGIDKEHEQHFILPQLDTIVSIEQGNRKVSIDTLYRLSEIYGVHMEDLVTLTGAE